MLLLTIWLCVVHSGGADVFAEQPSLTSTIAGVIYMLLFSACLVLPMICVRAMQGSGVDVFAVQPGLTSTSLYSGMQKTFVFYWFFVAMTFLFGQSPERGCLSLLYAATAPELKGVSRVYCPNGRVGCQ